MNWKSSPTALHLECANCLLIMIVAENRNCAMAAGAIENHYIENIGIISMLCLKQPQDMAKAHLATDSQLRPIVLCYCAAITRYSLTWIRNSATFLIIVGAPDGNFWKFARARPATRVDCYVKRHTDSQAVWGSNQLAKGLASLHVSRCPVSYFSSPASRFTVVICIPRYHSALDCL